MPATMKSIADAGADGVVSVRRQALVDARALQN